MSRPSIESFRVGDRVARVDNPRHVGSIVALVNQYWVRIKWDNGWREDIARPELDEIETVEK